ncbi:MAG TPA: DUF502 domain-containing protein [Flavobacterium sp.]|nr:DUF502 domain-containing protein [Flavobacterium sp.]
MKIIFRFIANTLTGGILIMIPLFLIIVLFGKANTYLLTISEPIAKRLPDIFLGFDGSKLLAIFLLILICFLCGLAFQSRFIKRWVEKIEVNVLCHMPGYSLLKSVIADAVGAKVENNMTSVLVKEGDGWIIGFLVEENEDLCTVYLPGAPKPSLGRIKIVPTASIQKLGVRMNVVAQSIKNFGKGAQAWMKVNK